MANIQKFPLPNMPFNREIHNGCAINTSIIVKAKAYPDNQKSAILELRANEDVALHMNIPLDRQKNMTINSKVNGQYSSDIEKPVYIPNGTTFTLHIRMNLHAAEIYKDNVHVVDFVHRVDPREVKEFSLEGPLVVEEIIFSPPQGASLDPLPSYEDAYKTSLPISAMNQLSLGGTGNQQSSSAIAGGVSTGTPVLRPQNDGLTTRNNAAPAYPYPSTTSSTQHPYAVPPQSSYPGSSQPSSSVPSTQKTQKNPPYPEKNNPGPPIATITPQQAVPPVVLPPQPQPQPQPLNFPQPQPVPIFNPPTQQQFGYAQQTGPQYPHPPQPYPYDPSRAAYNPYHIDGQPTIIHAQPVPTTQQVVYPQPPLPQTTIIQQQPYVVPSYPVYDYGCPPVFFEDFGHHHHHHHHC